MYLVVNNSKRLITISDLDVSIPPGSMLDLDRYKRNKHLNPRDSTDLQQALRLGILVTMKNDKTEKKEQSKQEPNSDNSSSTPSYEEMMKMMKQVIKEDRDEKSTSKTEEPSSNNVIDNEEMMKMMKQAIKEELNSKPNTEPQQVSSQQDNSQLIEMMSEIKNLISSGALKSSEIPGAVDDMEENIDEEKVKQIHAAAMKKMRDKNKTKSKNEFSYDTNTVKDDNISNSLEDLEDII